MKKVSALGLTLLLLLVSLLSACNGIPKAPVTTQFNLDKLVVENMTLDQVNALMRPALKSTYVLYQAQKATLIGGSWSIKVPEGGFTPGQTGDYQVIYFNPEKGKSEYYAIFFKGNICTGKAWFDTRGGPLMERLLKGEKVSS